MTKSCGATHPGADRFSYPSLLPNNPDHCKLYHAFLSAGILPRMGANKIILSPPLIFQREHVDEAMDSLHRGFRSIQ